MVKRYGAGYFIYDAYCDFGKGRYYHIINFLRTEAGEEKSAVDYKMSHFWSYWSNGKGDLRVAQCTRSSLDYIMNNRRSGYGLIGGEITKVGYTCEGGWGMKDFLEGSLE